MNVATRLSLAAIAVCLAPAAALVDAVVMPSDAYDGRPAMPRSRQLLRVAGEHVRKALEP